MARSSSVDLDSPDRPFDNIINFRDVGRTINHFCGAQIVKEGVLFRSARPDDASERDTRRLAEELHIASVIDLRSSTEHQMATRKRCAEKAESATGPPSGRPDEHLLRIPDAQLHRISLTGKSFEHALLWRLDWSNYLKAIAFAATGYRNDAVKLVGQQVMQPRGLTGLAQDTLDASTSELRSVFELLSRKASYPVLVHCTQGKDRTGLVVLMLLLLAGEKIPTPAIVDDYSRSELELVPEFEERMKEIRDLGLGEEYTRCPPGFVDATTEYLQSRYGGVQNYLSGIGINADVQDNIRQMLFG
ncbi:hypothetical protein N7468_008664 [Penicillium chermesinum]|uniref:Tyrosine specific protein phosphatases domain-containing protein n=1 Tax=Penicillium chermesinum TaxID=63820 RepID=A0A9W9NQ72_9EURO|nr:uncharacterized protein N7468_008664 [Penicillium chermesinum]KAJ5224122.1 hypothetical protein N7468_008664 [Penicillium chermesinum]KAJ6155064.1 hypothetical protein N7470_005630 [Penicillium chermesinum]